MQLFMYMVAVVIKLLTVVTIHFRFVSSGYVVVWHDNNKSQHNVSI